MIPRSHLPIISLALAACSTGLWAQRARVTPAERIEIILRETKPLTHPLGKRLQLYVWPAGNLPGETPEMERALRALAARGIAAYSSWSPGPAREDSLSRGITLGAIQKRLGLPVNINATDATYGVFDGSPGTAHVDAEGKPFFDMSSSSTRRLGCPFRVKQRYPEMRERIDAFCRAYRAAKVPVDMVFADWEIDGPIEWNGGWDAARRCVRCRENIPDIDNFASFQKAYRAVRSEVQRECFSGVVRKTFPKALVGNYGVYPNDGWRYWYDYYETDPPAGAPVRADQGAKYRQWVPEFEPSGYTFAMPVVYTWNRIWNWYRWENGDYRWFYNLLLVASNAGAHTPPSIPIISFVHYTTTSPPVPPDPAVRQFSEASYRELLWHMLLRGHDTFFLWCQANEIAAEIRPLHEVWAAALEYEDFLERGAPVTFDVPATPGPVISGLRLGNRILVRRTDFGPGGAGAASLLVDGRWIDVPPMAGKCQIITLGRAAGSAKANRLEKKDARD